MTDDEQNKADLNWCEFAAGSAVDELLVAKLISPDQADLAQKIIAQDLHIQLVSGRRPPNSK